MKTSKCSCGHDYDLHKRPWDPKLKRFKYQNSGPCEACDCKGFKRT